MKGLRVSYPWRNKTCPNAPPPQNWWIAFNNGILKSSIKSTSTSTTSRGKAISYAPVELPVTTTVPVAVAPGISATAVAPVATPVTSVAPAQPQTTAEEPAVAVIDDAVYDYDYDYGING